MDFGYSTLKSFKVLHKIMNQEKKTFDQFYLHPLKAYVFKFGQRD